MAEAGLTGAIRTSEHEQHARVFRDKCRVMVAYGACASFGGVPGLANLSSRQKLLDVAYHSTASTDNPDGVRPQVEHRLAGHTLTLPEFLPTLRSLPQVVAVDVVVPGCPPPLPRVLDLVGVLTAYAADGSLPPPGAILAESAALCDQCPRQQSRRGGRIESIRRPHEVVADSERCFVEQGILFQRLTRHVP